MTSQAMHTSESRIYGSRLTAVAASSRLAIKAAIRRKPRRCCGQEGSAHRYLRYTCYWNFSSLDHSLYTATWEGSPVATLTCFRPEVWMLGDVLKP